MASGTPTALYRDLDLIAGSGAVAGLGDAELLGRFADRGRADASAEAAFEAIVARHGPMVRATCRRALGDLDLADDAFQATFLVLVRQARSVRVGESLGPWLYAVARRVAAKARSRRGRAAVGVDPDRLAAPGRDDSNAIDLRPVVDEELGRLPAKYRAPVVLCHMEGRTLAEAAGLLRCPVGTVSGRLSRARAILRSRLARRGLGAPAAIAAWAASEAGAVAVPPALLGATIRAAMDLLGGGPAVPASILSLTRGVAFAMIAQKLKLAGVAALSTAAVLVAGVGHVSGRGQNLAPAPKGADSPDARPKGADAPPKPESGDARPKGAGSSDDLAPGADAAPKGADARPTPEGNPDPFFRPAAPNPFGLPPTPAEVLANRLQGVRNSAQGDFNTPKPAFGGAMSNGQILVVGLEDLRTFRGMNLNVGVWHEYAAPAGTQATVGLLDKGIAAIAYAGPGVREVAVYDGSLGVVDSQPEGMFGAGVMRTATGGWSRKALRAPSEGDVVAVRVGFLGGVPGQTLPGEVVIVYRVGNDVYVYDGNGRWSELHAEGDAPVVTQATPNAILVRQGAAVHVYSIPARRWIKDGEPPPEPGMRFEGKRAIRPDSRPK